MIPRYATPSMTAIWSDEARWGAALQVELAVLDAQAAVGQVPADAVAVIRAKARVDIARINELERTTDHDVVAFVNQLAESVGSEGRWIHHGLTSSDVVDTALALQMREAAALIDAGLSRLLRTIIRRAREERDTIMIGRTHGMHAEPTTMGAKMANWAFEVARSRERISLAAAEAATGKISGPVGTYSQINPEIERAALAALGLRADQASTQIVQRDRHAAFVAAIAIAGGTLERIATEIRHLQRSEVDEMREPFRSGQAGSSAMPQKRNPIKSERIAGLARLLRAMPLPQWRTSRSGMSVTLATAPPNASCSPMPPHFSPSWSSRSTASLTAPRSAESRCNETSMTGSDCMRRHGYSPHLLRRVHSERLHIDSCRGRPQELANARPNYAQSSTRPRRFVTH